MSQPFFWCLKITRIELLDGGWCGDAVMRILERMEASSKMERGTCDVWLGDMGFQNVLQSIMQRKIMYGGTCGDFPRKRTLAWSLAWDKRTTARKPGRHSTLGRISHGTWSYISLLCTELSELGPCRSIKAIAAQEAWKYVPVTLRTHGKHLLSRHKCTSLQVKGKIEGSKVKC
jgi:hypothetical protein